MGREKDAKIWFWFSFLRWPDTLFLFFFTLSLSHFLHKIFIFISSKNILIFLSFFPLKLLTQTTSPSLKQFPPSTTFRSITLQPYCSTKPPHFFHKLTPSTQPLVTAGPPHSPENTLYEQTHKTHSPPQINSSPLPQSPLATTDHPPNKNHNITIQTTRTTTTVPHK